MHLEFKRLTQIEPADITALNNHPKVLQQMPLGSPDFDDEKSRNWAEEKDAQWEINGYGPWAFVIDDVFAGWGGLQKEDDDADLALVLHPDFWGTGKIICDEIIRHAFDEMHLTSITILLPLSRKVSRFITRYGFQPDGSVNYDGVDFRRFRLFSDHTDGYD
ncbi:GNAT family N-acetyltransferase [Morganella morganii]|uniref:GNAT family N-acetyltransferase n=1 Tax=Morganella morganii TaxID=582 RepID=UPI000C9B284F|nr:GNAT family N-acetyltransferase [Morganella morganii]AUR31462.1 N-acetyltransferase [Morganella morganii]HDS5614704.1 GNAT family N-acetyltransferase [Morganella morganii subsp. morganii]